MNSAVSPRPAATAERLADLARRVSRLRPCHRDPERFHAEKSEITHELMTLANTLPEGGNP